MGELVYLNGQFMEFQEARVAVEDRGFMFGDGIYEVVRCYGGKTFSLLPHLVRLQKSAAAIELELPWSIAELVETAETLLAKSALAEALIYIQATRGAAPRQHLFPTGVEPTLLMTIRRFTPLPAEYNSLGVAVITVPDNRWGGCHIKSINLLPNVLAKEKAHKSGALEAVFVRHDGLVSEGGSSNLFAVLDGTVVTPPADHHILAGVTREHVLDLARQQYLKVEERPLHLADLRQAEEIFLTGTVMEVLPVVKLDDHLVGNGTPGPIAGKLWDLYRQRYREECGIGN